MSQHQNIEWKWIDDYPEYAISSNGIVRRRAWIANKGGNFWTKLVYRGGGELKQSLGRDGYVRVTLYKNNGKEFKIFFVHRLVAAAFICNDQNKPHVNHKNGVKTDNRVENLEWCTRLENQKHAVDNGLYKPRIGEKNAMAKLKDSDIHEIRALWSKGVSQHKIANMFSIAQSGINKIIHKKTWAHV